MWKWNGLSRVMTSYVQSTYLNGFPEAHVIRQQNSPAIPHCKLHTLHLIWEQRIQQEGRNSFWQIHGSQCRPGPLEKSPWVSVQHTFRERLKVHVILQLTSHRFVHRRVIGQIEWPVASVGIVLCRAERLAKIEECLAEAAAFHRETKFW